jgi:hypothetical protein
MAKSVVSAVRHVKIFFLQTTRYAVGTWQVTSKIYFTKVAQNNFIALQYHFWQDSGSKLYSEKLSTIC